VASPLEEDVRDQILAAVPEAREIAVRTLDFFKRTMEEHRAEIATFANFPSLFVGLINERGEPDFYDGKLRVVEADGKILADGLDPARYADYIAEHVEPWTYLKFPYYKERGYPDGLYRVGPLARLNIADRCGTPLADRELAEFRELNRGAVLSSFYYHYARLIEILSSIEQIEYLLNDPQALDPHVRASAGPNNLEGIGVSEAPRGVLIHHYQISEQGLITHANMIIATGHNNLAMNRGVLQVARRFVRGESLSEGMLNRVEAVIRAFDPCLSCSTHALGQMALHVQLVAPDGSVLDELRRDD
jgi:NAD-reducing hydrogenase large subunit